MKFKGKKRSYLRGGGVAWYKQFPEVVATGQAPTRNRYAIASEGHRANTGVIPAYTQRKKTNAEIMAEARRNQAIEREEQSLDRQDRINRGARVRTPNIGRPDVGNVTPIQGNRPNVPTQPIVIPSRRPVVRTPNPDNPQQIVNTNIGVEQPTQPLITRPVVDRDGNIVQGPEASSMTTPVQLQEQPNESVSTGNVDTNAINTPQLTIDGNTSTYRIDNPYIGPKYYRREFTTDNTGARVPTYFSGRDPKNLKRIRNYALVNRGPHYRAQQIFDKIDRGELKKQGGTINKLQQRGGWLFQQGGQLPQGGEITEEELIMDFAVRYLTAMGVNETDIVDPQGSLNEAYVDEMTEVLSQDIDWDSYLASPDEYIAQVIMQTNPEIVEIARKGTKLRRLKALRYTNKK